ncbi:Secondary metabolism regulator laeA like protein [Verticillium longisporum]|uniref:Secondary metabolism regulator laeA like protein n=1 Tax=Verticillium longisporum TaxID=100787 RepID=A0A8I2ZQJ7_VERLO|nr:Secondary metabolism regulator laeA like protein [Verticillium longisporum]
MHHGREYQQFAVDNYHYFEPIDEDEVDRLHILHWVLLQALDNRLLPSQLSRPRRVLECGFGAGDWAIDVAKAYPNCEVVAVDICPHMWPQDELPGNLNLQVDNVNERFTWPRGDFDLIHSQMMAGVIDTGRWPSYIRDIFQTLRRGGSAQREIGVANRENVRSLLSSMAAYPMTVFQGMASADFELLVAQARNEADNPRFKAYFSLYVCTGQKPQ